MGGPDKLSRLPLTPPFSIYWGGWEICDANGHVCTAENQEIAELIVQALVETYAKVRVEKVDP